MLNFVDIKDFASFIFFFFYAVLLPGYLLTRFLLPPKELKELSKILPAQEGSILYRYFYYIFAPASGLILIDAVVLLLARFNQALNFNTLFAVFSLLNVLLLLLNLWRFSSLKSTLGRKQQINKYAAMFVLIFLGSVLIRTIFYLPDVVPQDTDLGHHMYWAELMVKNEQFPAYDTPEVIEGEHMLFAVVSKLSGVSLLSAMPLIIISFYNLAMLLALFFASLVITANRKTALWVLFFSGIYYAIEPSQARYVKGGVIGNTFGNLLIPLVFLLVFLFFNWWFKYYLITKEEIKPDSRKGIVSLLSLAVIIILGSFYSHHLSTFLLGITLIFSIFVWLILSFLTSREKEYKISSGVVLQKTKNFFLKTIFSVKFLLVLLAVIIFPLFVYLPHYLANNAVETVTQEPEKDTHLGISLGDFMGKMGWIRFILLVVGGLILLLEGIKLLSENKKGRIANYILTFYKKYSSQNTSGPSYKMIVILLFGWSLPLAILSFAPWLLKIDLPSRRVVNYLVFPSVILVAIVANFLFQVIKNNIRKEHFKYVAVAIALMLLWDGTADFRGVYTGQNKFQDTVELYNASSYLAKNTSSDAVILKDHKSLPGDSWIKFFFLRGYDYFLSRTYDYKYTDIGNDLDPCTKEVVTVPDSSISRQCYGQTGISYVIVKPGGDEFLFWKGENFDAIYLNDYIAIFKVEN